MKHLSKKEILAKVRETKLLTEASESTAFTGIATLFSYVLWKEEKWGQKKLADFHTAIMEYDEKFYAGAVTIESMCERLWDKADFKIEYVPQTESMLKTKNKFLRDMEKIVMDAENSINEISQQYLLIGFCVLMDMGFGNKRLNRVKDNINKWLAVTSKDDGKKIMDLHRELVNEVGIYIEMPDILR